MLIHQNTKNMNMNMNKKKNMNMKMKKKKKNKKYIKKNKYKNIMINTSTICK